MPIRCQILTIVGIKKEVMYRDFPIVPRVGDVLLFIYHPEDNVYRDMKCVVKTVYIPEKGNPILLCYSATVDKGDRQ